MPIQRARASSVSTGEDFVLSATAWPVQSIVLDQDITIQVSDVDWNTDESYTTLFVLRQDATGGRTVTFNSAGAYFDFKWMDATTPTVGTDPWEETWFTVTVHGGATTAYGIPLGNKDGEPDSTVIIEQIVRLGTDASGVASGGTFENWGSWTTPDAGNLILMFFVVDTNAFNLTLSGFTEITQISNGAGTSAPNVCAFYKVSAGNESSTAIPSILTSQAGICFKMELSGVDAADPIDDFTLGVWDSDGTAEGDVDPFDGYVVMEANSIPQSRFFAVYATNFDYDMVGGDGFGVVGWEPIPAGTNEDFSNEMTVGVPGTVGAVIMTRPAEVVGTDGVFKGIFSTTGVTCGVGFVVNADT